MTIVRVFYVFCLVKSCWSQSASDQYEKFTNYSAVDFDNRTGFVSPTVDYCMAKANADHQSNGMMYNEALQSCIVLTTYNNEILVKLRVNPGWSTYVKDISNDLKLVVKYQNQLSTNALSQDALGIWMGTGGNYTSTYSAAVASIDVSTSCGCNYRNEFMDYWNVTEVYVQQSRNGLTVSQTVFNAVSSSRTQWFQRQNVLSATPYKRLDMAQAPILLFSSIIDTNRYRVLRYMMGSSGSCNTDYYYFIITNENSCNYLSLTKFSSILYSASQIRGSVAQSNLIAADFMSVYVKVASRVIMP